MDDVGIVDARRHRWLGWVIFVACAALVLAIFGYGAWLSRVHRMGTFTSTGPTLGDWTMEVDTCHSGSRKMFNGAQFYSSKDTRLGIWMVEDPIRGLVPSVNSTTNTHALSPDPADCKVLSGHANIVGYDLKPPYMVSGEYTVDCQVDQSHLTGHVVFKNCL